MSDSSLTYLLLIGILSLALIGAAITDVRRSRIPNFITFPLAGFGLFMHTVLDGMDGFLFSIEGLGVGFGLLFVFYLLGGMGAGDVKLLGAVGAVIGPYDAFIAFLITACLGGLYAIGLMALTWGIPSTAERVRVILTTWLVARMFTGPPPSEQGQPKLRYGLVIGLGALCSQAWRWMETTPF
ncbi:MAG: A24 family peptidase [Nitrospirales bacterium]|nr:prepilin peptidase [Nitrospira sp.]MDR4501781.1 A24 family peptidase [Nitrospirales bacterium]